MSLFDNPRTCKCSIFPKIFFPEPFLLQTRKKNVLFPVHNTQPKYYSSFEFDSNSFFYVLTLFFPKMAATCSYQRENTFLCVLSVFFSVILNCA